MSASRTFTPLTGGGVGGAFQAGDKFGFQTADLIREGLDVTAYLCGHLDLGGAETMGRQTATFVPVPSYREYTLNGDSLGGLTLEAVAFYKTFDAGTSVQVRVRNVTGGTTLASGAISTSTAVVKEVIALTLPSGNIDIRLEIQGGTASSPVFAWGYLRLRKVPA